MSHDADNDDDKYVDEDGVYRPPIYRSTHKSFSYAGKPRISLYACITELDGYPNEDENLYGEQSDREPDAPSLDITSDGHEFITIRQYMQQVHPWLLSLKDAYFDKFGRAMTGRRLPARTQLWFVHLNVHHIAFLDSATMKPQDGEWQPPARKASRILHRDPEDGYDDVDPEESLEDFLKPVQGK